MPKCQTVVFHCQTHFLLPKMAKFGSEKRQLATLDASASSAFFSNKPPLPPWTCRRQVETGWQPCSSGSGPAAPLTSLLLLLLLTCIASWVSPSCSLPLLYTCQHYFFPGNTRLIFLTFFLGVSSSFVFSFPSTELRTFLFRLLFCPFPCCLPLGPTLCRWLYHPPLPFCSIPLCL